MNKIENKTNHAFHFSFPQEWVKPLKLEALEKDITLTELMRNIIEEHLKNGQRK